MKRLDDIASFLHASCRGKSIVLHSGCAEPRGLAAMLAEHAQSIAGASLYTMMPMGASPYAYAEGAQSYTVNTFFPGTGLRRALNEGRATALRHPLSRIPGLFDRREIRADVLLLQVSAPDADGNVSLGISVDYMHAVLRQAPLVVAEINPDMPATCGDTRIPASAIDWYVQAQVAPQTVEPANADAVDGRIAQHVASLLDDGAVLQIGIGSVPDRVLASLAHLKHLGLHSGIITDAVRPLIESGVIDNSLKQRFRGVSVTAMAAGTQSFYRFLHRNPAIEFHPCSLTHDAATLAGIERMTAINGALQVDLEGRVNAESIHGRRVALPGGLPDFAAGAASAEKGLSIIAMRASFKDGTVSNIVDSLAAGEPTVPAEHVSHVVTEYGIAPVRGVAPAQRAAGLIAIAHPGLRDELQRQYAARR